METEFLNLGIVLILATIAGAIAVRFKQPAVLGLLLVGTIVGPHQLGLVKSTEVISFIAEIGAVLLLFAIGLEFSVSKLREHGLAAVLIASTKMLVIFVLGYLISSIMGLNQITALYLGAILSITSTAIMIKIVTEKRYENRPEVPVLISVLIVEDIIAIFLLTIFSTLTDTTNITNVLSIELISSILQALLLFSIFYLVFSKIATPILEWLFKYQAEETTSLTSLSLGIGLSIVATLLGLPASIGAFLAGNLIASVPQSDKFKHSVEPLILVFASLFFVSVGLTVNIAGAMNNALIIITLIIFAIIIKYIGMALTAYLFGVSEESAAFTGLAMLSIGEFSLLIASQANPALLGGFDLIGTTSILVFVLALASTITIDHYRYIAQLSAKFVPSKFKRIGLHASSRSRITLHLLESISGARSIFGNTMGQAKNYLLGAGALIGTLFLVYEAKQIFHIELQSTIITAITGIVLVIAGFLALKAILIVNKAYSQIKRNIHGSQYLEKLSIFILAGIIVLLMILFGPALGVNQPIIETIIIAVIIALLLNGTLKDKQEEKEYGLMFFKK